MSARSHLSVVFSTILSLALPGCTGAAKREARSLTEAVDRFRNANDASRASMADAVTKVECSDARVCGAKEVCLAAVGPTEKALALKNEVGARLADIEAARLAPDAAEAQALPLKLDEASRLLREGHTQMDRCDSMLADLRIAYGF